MTPTDYRDMRKRSPIRRDSCEPLPYVAPFLRTLQTQLMPQRIDTVFHLRIHDNWPPPFP